MITYIIMLIILLIVITFIYTFQGIKRLPKAKFTNLNGIVNIDDAIKYLESSNIKGWALVEEAQKIVSAKMSYSRRNNWDTYKQAFKRGMGYCQQQALALNHIFKKLGIDSKVVMAVKCKFPSKTIHEYQEPERNGGHTWLQVTFKGEDKYVCTCDMRNKPGIIHFQICSEVIENKYYLRPINHFFSMFVNIHKDNLALKRIKNSKKFYRNI